MQLMPIMESPQLLHSIETQEVIAEELFPSLLEALSTEATTIPQIGTAEGKNDTLGLILPAPHSEEDVTDFTLIAALLSLVATPIPQESMVQSGIPPEELILEDASSFQVHEALGQSPNSASAAAEFLAQLEASSLEPKELLEELEALVVATEQSPEGEFIPPEPMQATQAPLAKEQIQVGQAVESILDSLFRPKEPLHSKSLFLALFPEVQPLPVSVDSPQEVALQPLVYLVPPPQAEESQEPLSHLPLTIASAVEPEKPSLEERAQEPQDVGFILTPGSRGSETSKLDGPPAPQEPYSFEEVMSRATVRVGKQIQELAVRIQPQNLGRVLLRVAVEEGQLVAKFLTESNQAKGILELHLPQLRESLAKEGLVLERCLVTLGQGQEFGQQERQEHRSRYRPPRRAVNYEDHLTQSEPGEQVGLVNFLA